MSWGQSKRHFREQGRAAPRVRGSGAAAKTLPLRRGARRRTASSSASSPRRTELGDLGRVVPTLIRGAAERSYAHARCRRAGDVEPACPIVLAGGAESRRCTLETGSSTCSGDPVAASPSSSPPSRGPGTTYFVSGSGLRTSPSHVDEIGATTGSPRCRRSSECEGRAGPPVPDLVRQRFPSGRERGDRAGLEDPAGRMIHRRFAVPGDRRPWQFRPDLRHRHSDGHRCTPRALSCAGPCSGDEIRSAAASTAS